MHYSPHQLAYVDLKVGKLAHGDLGQMLMYANYYDREVAARDDNPTIGLILCSEKNDVVRDVWPTRTNRSSPAETSFCVAVAGRLGLRESQTESPGKLPAALDAVPDRRP